MTQHDGRHEDPGGKVREEMSKAGESIKEEVAEVGANARDAARKEANAQFDKGRAIADEQLDTLSSAVDDAASRLDEEGHPLASYAGELSTQLGRLSTTIQSSSLDDVAKSTHRLARDNPGLFMLGSVALGFAAARFMKASDDRDHRSDPVSGSGVGNRTFPETRRVPGSHHSSDRDYSGRSDTASVTRVSSVSPGESTSDHFVRGGEA